MSSLRHKWQDEAACLGDELELYFDNYEADSEPFDLRRETDRMCLYCPVVRTCFAYAKYYPATGVWGGMYLIDGAISPDLNKHKTPDDWAQLYAAIIR